MVIGREMIKFKKMRRKIIDLQIHTTGSDGVFSPAKVVEKARINGLAAIAITDHDSVAGLDEGMEAGKRLGIEVVPGIEFTCYQGKEEIHVLGYLFDWRNKKLAEKLVFFRQGREERAKRIVKALQKLGFSITLKQVKSLAKEVVAKPHLAQALIENPANQEKLLKEFGRMPTIGQFIRAYLVLGKPAFITKPGFTPQEAIDSIHSFEGLAVLSHPGYSFKIADKKKLIRLFGKKLDGLEVIYPYFPDKIKKTQKIINDFDQLAEELSLFKTGGSDYHGRGRGEPDIGLVNFPWEVPWEFLQRMKKAHQ
ncbi:MAG TPA: PHP domain-containing protein [Candidatus Bathyarchaeia archaeon]|nr:PHP domain-containing protein [Candidatus Bathyarchaeia archaeon]